MGVSEIMKENELINLFVDLAKIPSPPLEEENVIEKILEIFHAAGINAHKDSYGNIIAEVKATDTSKKPLLLSAHMDVVGDNSPVNILLNGDFIETDKKRTLGADDKAGVAAVILLAKEISGNNELKHGGLEIVFTRDEEHGMSGIKNLDMKLIESEYILVLDADKLGQILISGAGFKKLTLKVETAKGGHSGIDIGDATRLNAVKLIAELITKIPQGVYKKDEYGVITSINAGAIIGGGVKSGITHLCPDYDPSIDVEDYVLANSMTNIINTACGVVYSLRSSDAAAEKDLLEEIQQIISDFNLKYKDHAKASLEVEIHLPIFEKSEDTIILEAAKKSAERLNINPEISSFHAGAETHIYANSKNKSGKQFKPVLIGLADIYNMHSSDEKIDYKSYIKGYEFLKEIFISFNA